MRPKTRVHLRLKVPEGWGQWLVSHGYTRAIKGRIEPNATRFFQEMLDGMLKGEFDFWGAVQKKTEKT